jgi:hypothetical protein
LILLENVTLASEKVVSEPQGPDTTEELKLPTSPLRKRDIQLPLFPLSGNWSNLISDLNCAPLQDVERKETGFDFRTSITHRSPQTGQ